MFDIKKIAATGGAGMIGSEVCEKLVSQNCRVVVVDDFSRGNRSNLSKINDHIYLFRRLINHKNLLVDSITPIQPLVIGDAKKAVKISNLLIELGFYVPAIRPPTVPTESARLRVSISALHSKGDIKKLVQAINKIIENEN